VGKTRLAIEVGWAIAPVFAHGVHFADLSMISESSLVPSALAAAAGIRETGEPVMAQLFRALRARQMLLVLDNLEHLVPVREQIAGLYAECPGLKFLVTSRVPLHLHAERVFLLRPLELPDGLAFRTRERFTSISSVALFLDRAQAARGEFTLRTVDVPAVAEICRRLDGLPLAIELAAARTKSVTPSALLELLAQSHAPMADLLSTPYPDLTPRHRTMQAALAWSYQLLSPELKLLLRRLSVFPGGCTKDAMEHVCMGADLTISALEGLEALVEHNLLERESQPDGSSRYRLLSTIREFALNECASTQELPSLRERHACYFASFAEEAAPHLWETDQIAWLDRLKVELANLRSALDWSLAPDGDPDLALRLGGSLHRFWGLAGHWDEGTRLFDRMLPALTQQSPLRVRMLVSRGYHAIMRADWAMGSAMMAEAHREASAIGDAWGVAYGLLGQGVITWTQGDKNTGLSMVTAGIERARVAGETIPLAYGLLYQALIELAERNHLPAATLAQEALQLGRGHGNREFLQLAHFVLGLSALLRGHAADALSEFREGLHAACELNEPTAIATSLEGIGWTGVTVGDVDWGVRLLAAADALREHIGGIVPPILTWYLHHERYPKIARRRLGEAQYTAAWAAGASLAPEDAVAEAMAAARPAITLGARLTRRETDVAQLIAEGCSNRQIAAALLIGERTAESHVQHILDKLGLRSRTQIAAWAVASSPPAAKSRTAPP
jgi:non-specific serine/threonine protein kinase